MAELEVISASFDTFRHGINDNPACPTKLSPRKKPRQPRRQHAPPLINWR
jgi:hypothetical protein